MRWITVAFLGSVVASLAAPVPALAHWEKTRWGMTQAELKAVYPSAAVAANPKIMFVDGVFNFAGLVFGRAGFMFGANGGLSQIVVYPAPTDPEGFRETLVRMLGPPAEDRVMEGPQGTVRAALFFDPANGNQILFVTPAMGSAAPVNISFMPLG